VRALQIGIFVLITFAVASHGAVEVWSQTILEIGAAILFLLWTLGFLVSGSREIYWSVLNWPVVALLFWAFLQLLLRLTIYPYLTWTSLMLWTAGFLIYFVASQVFQDKISLRMLVWFFMSLAFATALFGIIQYFTWNGKIYWVRELTQGGEFFGPYVNRNHFAGLMELLIPIGLCMLIFRGIRRDLEFLATLLTLIPVGALFLAGSRGGLIAFGFEIAFLIVIYFVRKAGSIRLAPVIGFVLVLLSLLAWIGAGRVLERFSVKHASDVTMSRRRSMFVDTARVFLHHPLAGTGLGTLVNVYPRYETAYDGKLVDHAHNDYVETASDLGLPGIICSLFFIVLLAWRGFSILEAPQSHFSVAYHAAALIACGGMLVHSFVDFNLHIPSNALIFLFQANLAVTVPLSQDRVTKRKCST
jgi:O-antigen ligase